MTIVAAIHLSSADEKQCYHCGLPFYRDKRCTWAHWNRSRFCGRACVGLFKTTEANRNRAPMAEVFARWIDQSADCWIWTGALDKDGYGAFSYAGKTRRAPIVALELDGRKPKRGEYACHRCDTPACVRPSHLYPGTPTQNMADAIARGRLQNGERRHMAKLTAKAVVEIRNSSLPDPVLAERFGVTDGAINMARRGKTWKHVA